MKQLKNKSLSQVQKLARLTAKKYTNKDAVIGLTGPLGAGKTAFTKAFGRALGIKKIKSPTFIVASTHQLAKRELHHLDFYRLKSRKELEPLGITEMIAKKNRIILIEWVDKFPSIEKLCDTVINFEVAATNLRHVTFK